MPRLKNQTLSKLFAHIEKEQADQPWGSFLDAGSGVQSIKWVMQLPTEQWTAVTGAPQDARVIEQTTDGHRRSQDRVVLGNWAKSDLLKGERYDTVLADYLLGAVEGFAPYFQPYLLARLRPATRKRLYFTGAEPYVPTNEPTTLAGRLVWKIGRFRDACLLLSGELPYREYPSAWVMDQMVRSGFKPRSIERFETRYKAKFVNTQIDLSLHALNSVTDENSALALSELGEKLRNEALAVVASEGSLTHGQDYVISAEPISS
ncbi:MAG: class I SAM-dependent methyltransferase [Pseudomonadota bacterium]